MVAVIYQYQIQFDIHTHVIIVNISAMNIAHATADVLKWHGGRLIGQMVVAAASSAFTDTVKKQVAQEASAETFTECTLSQAELMREAAKAKEKAKLQADTDAKEKASIEHSKANDWAEMTVAFLRRANFIPAVIPLAISASAEEEAEVEPSWVPCVDALPAVDFWDQLGTSMAQEARRAGNDAVHKAEWLQSIHTNRASWMPDRSTGEWINSRYINGSLSDVPGVYAAVSKFASTHSDAIGSVAVTLLVVKSFVLARWCLERACCVRLKKKDAAAVTIQYHTAGLLDRPGAKSDGQKLDEHIAWLFEQIRLDAITILENFTDNYKVNSKQ